MPCENCFKPAPCPHYLWKALQTGEVLRFANRADSFAPRAEGGFTPNASLAELMRQAAARRPHHGEVLLMRHAYPTSFAAVRGWAAENRLSEDEAWRRFVYYAVLVTIGDDWSFADVLVLRGAGALSLFCGGHRSIRDLDFLCLRSQPGQDIAAVQTRLNEQLNHYLPRMFPDYSTRVTWIQQNLKVDISPCDLLTDCTPIRLNPQTPHELKVCTLEDIIADKLVVFLMADEQAHRKRERDLFDIADVLRNSSILDLSRISELITAKGAVRRVSVSARGFTPNLRSRVAAVFDSLQEELGQHFIPFNLAWDSVVALVSRLERV
ncbi:MAG: nucleotidyl transferase AbiEii/AbiGii toxin family protein [Nitrospira sp.]|nr:nucleotidyl transferase AbiEii/AbiGii toxin family protein [Nitrospira sp.]